MSLHRPTRRAPRACGPPASGSVSRAQVAAQQVAALGLRQEAGELRMRVGEHRAQPVEEPVDLAGPAEEHAAQHAAGHPVRIGLGVGQRQRRAPGAAEQQPAVDAEMPAQPLDVLDQVVGGVVGQAAERARPPGAALVEDHHAPEVGVEEAPVHRARAGARAAMQEQHRPAARIADLLPVHDMAGRERQVAGLERADLGKQVAAWHGAQCYRRRAVGGTGLRTQVCPDPRWQDGGRRQCGAHGSASGRWPGSAR